MLKIKIKSGLILGLLAVFLLTSALSCGAPSGEEGPQKLEEINLVYWRVKDERDDFAELIDQFNQRYSHINITYRQIREEVYEETLWKAWAKDEGPDIFSIPSTWLGKYQEMISPIPLKGPIKMQREVMVGTIKKEPQVREETDNMYGLIDLKQNFVDLISEDVVVNDQIYGLPLSMDILVLYYNQDMLNNAAIPYPPATWQSFAEQVAKLVIEDREGEILQAGASLGGAENIRYLTDIISLLMLQNGTTMVQQNQAVFYEPPVEDPSYFPGIEALRFYTDFADSSKNIYTWNETLPESREAFINNKTAFYIGYYSDLPYIRTQAPKLNFGIAPVPQIAGSLKKINFADYWLETVSRKTAHPDACWAFLKFVTQPENAQYFLSKTGYPTAHKDWINAQLEDVDLAPFAQGVLTAQSWYKGKNYPLVKEAFQRMVRDVLEGSKTYLEAAQWCAQKVNLTY